MLASALLFLHLYVIDVIPCSGWCDNFHKIWISFSYQCFIHSIGSVIQNTSQNKKGQWRVRTCGDKHLSLKLLKLKKVDTTQLETSFKTWNIKTLHTTCKVENSKAMWKKTERVSLLIIILRESFCLWRIIINNERGNHISMSLTWLVEALLIARSTKLMEDDKKTKINTTLELHRWKQKYQLPRNMEINRVSKVWDFSPLSPEVTKKKANILHNSFNVWAGRKRKKEQQKHLQVEEIAQMFQWGLVSTVLLDELQ